MSAKPEQVDSYTVRVRCSGRVYLVAAECPHRRGRLAYGHVSEAVSRLSCPLHHSTFDLRTGAVVAGPADHPLQVQVESGGDVPARNDPR
jgi:nitrite reductase/ring-hydroxylating ferredoxin subunit